MVKKYKKQPLLEHNRMRLVEISSYFRNMRKLSGLSQEEVAESGISLGTIKYVESGYFGNPKNISLKTLFDLADYYQLPLREVFDMD